MGTDEKNRQHPSPNNQKKASKGPEGEQRTDQSLEDKKSEMKKKGDKKEAKAGQPEESHTCCGCRFPLLVALLQLTLGISITVVAFIMAWSCSSLLVRDTPYWAGIIVSIKTA
ncbi:hypothetical protein FKM82_011522 [Ascaphus truei]